MNIFARQLNVVLQKYGRDLSSLYSLGASFIPPNQVRRLKRSLRDDMTATLSTEDIEELQQVLGLDDDDMRQLRAALIAEAARSLLAGRIRTDLATEAGEMVFRLMLDASDREFLALRERIQEIARDAQRGAVTVIPSPNDLDEEQSTQGLEPAIEVYERGLLWLEIAQGSSDRVMRKGFIALATSLLTSARELAAYPSAEADGTSQQTNWIQLIDAALASISYMR